MEDANRASADRGQVILVTGGAGFVGSAVVRRLVGSGHRVRALIRSTSDSRNLRCLPIDTITGDLTDRHSLKQALRGCDVLFHVAADYRLWVPEPKRMYENNVRGTEKIMEEALKAGVRKIIYTSSVATLRLSGNGAPADETSAASLKHMIGHYKRSKFMAEAAVLRLIETRGLPAVVVNPSTPVGPGDIKPTPTGRFIADAVAGRMPAYVNTGLNIVHVDDVARGHLLALEHGRIGERYILGGHNMTLKEILMEIAAIAGCTPPRVCIPHKLILSVALLSEVWARCASGREPRVSLDGARMARKQMFFSSEKAEQELAYTPRPAREALTDAVHWFLQNGYGNKQRKP
ncbi:MAG: NAD-dependent epimerase/dehydratase family protein [Deltaproteobacteria bacterium]|nr:NAD-dependent epimerase/dehydratase family protein [Deltaproteobacteria bacterium]